jgi:alcohol dehydrogenase
MRHGYAEFTGIPGHEFVGVVERVSRPEHRHWIGQRVVGNINIGCGTCRACLDGVKEHCETREVLGIRQRHGAFAEFLTLPPQNLHPVPDAVSDGAAVFTEPIAAGCRILEQVAMGPGQQVAVMGDGRMGLLIAQVLRTTGAVVVLYGKHAARLALARRLGIDARPTPGAALPASNRHDIVVEVTGRADGLVRALGCVRPRGTLVLKSTVHDASTMATWPIVVDEVSIVGSRCGPFSPAIEMLATGAVKTEPLVEGMFKLSEFDHAFAAAEGGLKVLFALA